MANDQRFAVLIDADNISDKYIKVILDEISNDGIATYKRIYGDWTKPALSSWKAVLLDHSILPVQQYSYTTGKNSTDSAMIIDAMDILYSGQVDGFCLVSSDSDFTRLAARLRESGMIVVGMGEKKTPKSFIAACNRFRYLDVLAAAEQPRAAASVPLERTEKENRPSAGRVQTPAKAPAAKPAEKSARIGAPAKNEDAEPKTDLATIRAALVAIVTENSDDDDWILIARIGNLLGKRYPDFDVRNFGFSKLTPFLESLDLFHVKTRPALNGNGKLVYVKLK
ncbi:MAG: hypothetical protein DBX44_08600 [Oscillospiraceae bacterium]|nr:MAG: hypothetical protein DBX44_08600 [Oscillospiraceae bacterium]